MDTLDHVMDRATRGELPVGGYVCGGVGALLLLTALLWAWSSFRFQQGALRTTGKVARLVRESSTVQDGPRRKTHVTFAPVVRFKTQDGNPQEFTGLGASPPDYTEGQTVSVLYRKENPRKARIASVQELWAGPLAIGAFGLIFALAGALLHRMRM